MTIYKDQLEAVYKLIEKPEAWTQEAAARLSDGTKVQNLTEPAVSFCVWGACEKVRHYGEYQFSHVLGFKNPGDLIRWNDDPERTHAEVLQLLKSAIDRAPVRP